MLIYCKHGYNKAKCENRGPVCIQNQYVIMESHAFGQFLDSLYRILDGNRVLNRLI